MYDGLYLHETSSGAINVCMKVHLKFRNVLLFAMPHLVKHYQLCNIRLVVDHKSIRCNKILSFFCLMSISALLDDNSVTGIISSFLGRGWLHSCNSSVEVKNCGTLPKPLNCSRACMSQQDNHTRLVLHPTCLCPCNEESL